MVLSLLVDDINKRVKTVKVFTLLLSVFLVVR